MLLYATQQKNKDMITSKRFLAFLIAVGMFESGIFFTDYTPMELASAITMITAVYTASETIRKSDNQEKVINK